MGSWVDELLIKVRQMLGDNVYSLCEYRKKRIKEGTFPTKFDYLEYVRKKNKAIKDKEKKDRKSHNEKVTRRFRLPKKPPGSDK